MGILVALQTVPVDADAALSRIGTPAIGVHALGPMGLIKIHMVSTDLSVAEKDGTITFTSDLNRLTDTDSDLRARHMRAELQADKFPDVVLTVQRADLKFPAEGAKVEAESPGMLTLHGVTKPIRFHYSASGTKPQYDVSGFMSVDYTEFLGHKISKFGATVQPTVKVDVHARLSDTDS